MKKISIIIVTYFSNELIEGCLDSIIYFNDIDEQFLEIIIVDNSDKNTFEKLSKIVLGNYFFSIKLIKNNDNYGYGSGNNIGISVAEGDIICIMNPDVRLKEPLFQVVQHEFKKSENLCMLGFKQIGGKNISYFLKNEYYWPILSSIIVKFANRFNLYFQKYFFLSGAFLFIDKIKFEKIGLFDSNFFLYMEESDISNRFLNQNCKIKFIKDIKYEHCMGNKEEYSENSFKVWLSSLIYYLEKYNISKNIFLKKLIFEYNIKALIYTILRNNDKARLILKRGKVLKEMSLVQNRD